MNENQKDFLGKKRNIINIPLNYNLSNNINFNINNNTNHNNSNIVKNTKEPIILTAHSHWINQILILKHQPNHNLISSSADGQIILYNEYPKYNPVLKMQLFGESGVLNLTELKDGTIIACSFAAIKQILIKHDNIKNTYSYEVVNYSIICSTYISKCLELFNDELLCLTQQNIIIFLEKNKNNPISEYKDRNYITKNILELLKYELCINILQLTEELFISCNITNPKYDLTDENINKPEINCIKFYNKNFNCISKISKIYSSKSQNNIVKINTKYVLVGVEICSNEINWNNNKGVALINYKNFELITFYEIDNQVSSILYWENKIYIGDDKGYVTQFNFDENEIILKQTKRIHQYNISALEYDIIYDKEKNKNIFILLTGSNDQTIKISYCFND